jgi:hypothetical protein
MAIIFELYAECKDMGSTQNFAAHFQEVNHTLLNGRTIRWNVALAPSYPTVVTVWSPDLSHSGVQTLQDAVESTEAGLRLYLHLQSAPEFRYARVGWEVENVPMAELQDYMDVDKNGRKHLSLNCVLDDELYQQLGSPMFFYPFRKGYRWNRYRGESYQPLHSNDQSALNELCQNLLSKEFPD